MRVKHLAHHDQSVSVSCFCCIYKYLHPYLTVFFRVTLWYHYLLNLDNYMDD